METRDMYPVAQMDVAPVAERNARLAAKLQQQKVQTAESEALELRQELLTQQAVFKDTLFSMEAAHHGCLNRLKEVATSAYEVEAKVHSALTQFSTSLVPFGLQVVVSSEQAQRQQIELEALQYLMLREASPPVTQRYASRRQVFEDDLQPSPSRVNEPSGRSRSGNMMMPSTCEDDAASRMLRALEEYKEQKDAALATNQGDHSHRLVASLGNEGQTGERAELNLPKSSATLLPKDLRMVADEASRAALKREQEVVERCHDDRVSQLMDFATLFSTPPGIEGAQGSKSTSPAVHNLLWKFLPCVGKVSSDLRACLDLAAEERTKIARIFHQQRPGNEDPSKNVFFGDGSDGHRGGEWIEALAGSALAMSTAASHHHSPHKNWNSQSVHVQTVLTKHPDLAVQDDSVHLPPGSEPLLFTTSSYEAWNGKATLPLTKQARSMEPGPTPSKRTWVELEVQNAELAKACRDLGNELDEVKELFTHKLTQKDKKVQTLEMELAVIRHEYIQVTNRQGPMSTPGVAFDSSRSNAEPHSHQLRSPPSVLAPSSITKKTFTTLGVKLEGEVSGDAASDVKGAKPQGVSEKGNGGGDESFQENEEDPNLSGRWLIPSKVKTTAAGHSKGLFASETSYEAESALIDPKRTKGSPRGSSPQPKKPRGALAETPTRLASARHERGSGGEVWADQRHVAKMAKLQEAARLEVQRPPIEAVGELPHETQEEHRAVPSSSGYPPVPNSLRFEEDAPAPAPHKAPSTTASQEAPAPQSISNVVHPELVSPRTAILLGQSPSLTIKIKPQSLDNGRAESLVKRIEDFHADMLAMESIARATADGATRQRMLRQLTQQHEALATSVVPLLHDRLRSEAERIRLSQSPAR